MFKKIVSYLLIISFFMPFPLSVRASITSIEDPNLPATESFFKGPLPASPHFKAQTGLTAAGVMPIIQNKGKLYTILGKRDDTQTWCNFGGKTEEGQTYLSQTAAQELMEESCGLYACASGALNQNPSHTLQLPDVTYRMYMRNFEYLPSFHFMERMGQSTKHSSQEYTDFAFFEIDALLSGAPLIANHLHPDDENRFLDQFESFELFDDFNKMLQEPSVQSVLSNWGKNPSTLHTFRRADGPQESTILAPRVLWGAVKGTQGVALQPSETAFMLPYGQNAAGKKTSNKIYMNGLDALILPVPMNPEIEREIFAHAVVKKSRTLMELKGKFPSEAEVPSPTPEAWTPLMEEFRKASPSERHLKWVLAEKFTEGRTKEAYAANIRIYLEDLNQQHRMEQRGKVPVTDEVINKLVTLLHQEVEALQHPTDPRLPLYHGASGEIGELYSIFSHLKQTLRAEPLSGHHLAHPTFTDTPMHPMLLNGVRGTDMYYKGMIEVLQNPTHQGLTPVEIIYQEFSKSDYDPTTMATRMCTNPSLTCGPELGASTSNSVEYWLKGHSVCSVPTQKFFDETLALLGINAEFSLFDSVFRQYHGVFSEGDLNGLMIQMFVTPDFIHNATHAAYIDPHGVPSHPSVVLQHKAAHHQYTNLLNLTAEKRQHYPEMWAYPTPTRAPRSVQFLSYQLKDLEKNKLDRMQHHLSETWDHVVTDWLGSHTRLQTGALHEGDPLLHKLHRMASQIHGGEVIKEKLPQNALTHLIKLDIPEGVQMLVTENPGCIESISEKDRRHLLIQTLSLGREKMATLLSQIFYKAQDYAQTLTFEEAHVVVTSSLSSLSNFSNLDTLKVLDHKFHFKTWDASYHTHWFSLPGLFEEESFPHFSELIEIFGHSFSKEMLHHILHSYDPRFPGWFAQNPDLAFQININEHLEEWIDEYDCLNPDLLENHDYATRCLNLLEALGVDWGLFYKNRPLLSYFSHVTGSHGPCTFNGEPYTLLGISRLLQQYPHLTHQTDFEGRNLRQLAELDLMDGKPFNELRYCDDLFTHPDLKSSFPEFGNSSGGDLSKAYSLLNETPLESRPLFLEYLRAWAQYQQERQDLTNKGEYGLRTKLDEQFYATHASQIDELKERGNVIGSIQDDVYHGGKSWDQKKALTQEAETVKQHLIDACLNNNAEACASILQSPRWRHLALPALASAFHRESFAVAIKILNNFVDWKKEFSAYGLDDVTQCLNSYNFYSHPKFFSDIFPDLNIVTINNLLLQKEGGILDSLRKQDALVKDKIVSRFSLEQLHTLRNTRGKSMLHFLLSDFQKEDRVWVEKITPALSWIDPDTSFPYGAMAALMSAYKGSFPHFEDLMDLSLLTTPCAALHATPYDIMQYGPFSIVKEKIDPFLKKQGLI